MSHVKIKTHLRFNVGKRASRIPFYTFLNRVSLLNVEILLVDCLGWSPSIRIPCERLPTTRPAIRTIQGRDPIWFRDE